MLLKALTVFTVLNLFAHMSMSSTILQFFKGRDYALRMYFSVPCFTQYTTWNKKKLRMNMCKKNEGRNIVYIALWHHSAGPIPLTLESRGQ